MEEAVAVWASMEIGSTLAELLEGKGNKDVVLVHINGKPVALPLTNKGDVSKSMRSKSVLGKVLASEAQGITEQQLIKQMEELTMTNTTTNTNTEATEVIENIKNGQSTVASKGAVVEAVSKAWASVRGYDYKAAFNKAVTAIGEAFTSTKAWFNESRTGKAISSTAKYAGYALLAGAFISTGSIALNAVLTIAAGTALVGMHNAVKAVAFDKQDLSVKDHAIGFLKAAAGMTAFVTAAWFVAPLLYAGIYYVASMAMSSVVYSFVVIFG